MKIYAKEYICPKEDYFLCGLLQRAEGPIWCKCLGTCNLHFDILNFAPSSGQILFCILQIIFGHFKNL